MDVKGIIFDMDGVIFDTENISLRTWIMVEEKYGISIDRSKIHRLMGSGHHNILDLYGEIMGDADLGREVYAWRHGAIERIIRESGAPVKPGFPELVAYLRGRGLPMALATSSTAPKVAFTFRHSSIENPFTCMVTGDMIKANKPDPEIFLKAAALMNVDIRDCVIIEDSINGVLGGAASGAKTIMVPDVVRPDKALRDLCHAVAASLYDVIPLLEN